MGNSSNEHATFFVYQEGKSPNILKLGSLVLDYANPTLYEPYVNPENCEQDPTLVETSHRSNCSFTLAEFRQFGFRAGISSSLNAGATRRSINDADITADRGRRMEIISPQTFLNTRILPSPDAQRWLRRTLSVTRKLEHVFKTCTFHHPHIWFVTGIYVLHNATYSDIRSSTTSHNGGVAVPIVEPSGIATALNLDINSHGDYEAGNRTRASSTIQGDSVVAAQFAQLGVKYVYRKLGEEISLPTEIRLRDLIHKSGIRSGEHTSSTVPVACLLLTNDDGEDVTEAAVNEKTGMVEADNSQTFSEKEAEYWNAFDREIQAQKRYEDHCAKMESSNPVP